MIAPLNIYHCYSHPLTFILWVENILCDAENNKCTKWTSIWERAVKTKCDKNGWQNQNRVRPSAWGHKPNYPEEESGTKKTYCDGYLNLVKWYFDNQIVAVIKNVLLVQHITDTTWYKFPSSQCSYHIWHKIHELTHPFMILYKIGSWHFKVFLVNNGKFVVCWSILGPMCHRVIYSFVFCCKVIKLGCKRFKW